MKKIILSLCTIMGLGICANAQNAWVQDSVTMGPGSANDVYYSLANGLVKTENNLNWHLGFSMNAGDSSSIWANHNNGNAFVKVYNIHKNASQWAGVSLADTTGATLCYNLDKEYSQGALNDIPSADPFNFGWGTYDMVSHNIYGDSIFIVNANNVFYKVLIDSLHTATMTYDFTVGDIVANTSNHYSLAKGTKYANSIFAYFDLATGTDSLREPSNGEWDIVFNRYNSLVALGPPPTPATPYSVIGAFGNRGVTFGKAAMVHVDTAHNNVGTYTTPWNKIISTIGYDWKIFTPPAGPWLIPDSLSYFIKDKNGLIFQMQFTDYSGSGTGNINFRKRQLYPTAVNDISSKIANYNIFPVPAQNELNIVLDAKEIANAQIQLIDFTGKSILKTTISIQQGMNAYTIPCSNVANGNYILSIIGKNISIKEKVNILK